MKNPNLKENESDNMIRHKSSHKGIFSSLLALTFMGSLAVKAETDFDKIADQRCFAEEPATITDLKIEKILAYDKYTSVNIQPLFRSNDELMSMSVWRASSTDPDVESTIDIYKNMEKMTVWIPSKDVWESLHYAKTKTIDNKSASIVEVIPGKTFMLHHPLRAIFAW